MTYEQQQARFVELSKDFVMGKEELFITTYIASIGHDLGIPMKDAPGLLRRIASLIETAQKEGLFKEETT